MTAERLLAVTLDTEVDKDARWCVADPPAFRSVTHGVPEVLGPLFERHGVVPTYLLSPEVIEDPEAAAVLAGLGDRAELGTHLHAEFAEPERTLTPATMAGAPTTAMQVSLTREIEAAKLAWLTDLFASTFGYRPRSFRAGRFGMSPSTAEILAGLGYVVDSSVTPGLRWSYPEGEVDFRDWTREPRRLETPAGPLVELPVSIRGPGAAGRLLADVPGRPGRLARRALGRRGSAQWLRPSWSDAAALRRWVRSTDDRVMVLMLHSMEIVPGASPYAADREGVDRIVAAMDGLFAACRSAGVRFCGLTDAANAAVA